MRTPTQQARTLALAAIAGLAFTLTGCDRKSADSRAIEKSATELTSLTGGDTALPPPSAADKTFKAAQTELSDVLKSSDAGQKNPATLLSSQVETGLAQGPADSAIAQDAALRSLIGQVETKLIIWSRRSSSAAASESYDPNSQLAEISKSRNALVGRIEEQNAKKAQLQAQLADLQSRMKEKFDAATALEAEYAAKIASAQNMSAAAGVSVVEEAAKIKRQADKLRLEGGTIEAEASVLAPEVTNAVEIARQLTKQMADYGEIEAELNARAAASREEAAAARADANTAADDINRTVKSIQELYKGGFESAYASAINGFEKAAKTANAGANGSSTTTGKLSAGEAHQSLAVMHLARSKAANAFSGLLQSLAKTTPALPDASQYATLANEVRADRDKYVDSAISALESAKSSFSGARLTGEAKDRITKLTESIENTRAKLEAAKLGLPDGVDANLAKLLTDTLTWTGEDNVAELATNTFTASPELREYANLNAQAAIAMLKADAACKAKFGKGMQDLFANMSGPIGTMSTQFVGEMQKAEKAAAAAKSLSLSTLDIKVNGDRATANGTGLPEPFEFIRSENRWWIFSKQLSVQDPAAAMRISITKSLMTPMSKVFGDWAADVEGGKFESESAATEDLGTKLTAAIQEVMKSRMGGAGGPG